MSSKVTDVSSESQQTQTSPKGVLYVVSSPSGGGKGTLIRRMLDVVTDLSYSVSYTTRAPRNGEVNGREYFFVDREQFQSMVAAGAFLEWANVHGNLYGTAKDQVISETSAGHDIVLEVDVQGADSVRKLGLDSVSIFILPPSLETLRQRLITRGADSPEELAVRLRNAPEELKQYIAFDYIIFNDEIERASTQLAAIISAERARRSRQEGLVREVIENFKA
jgi:guanylate kinase